MGNLAKQKIVKQRFNIAISFQAKILHFGEREKLCVFQAKHGPQIDSTLSLGDGLPGHIRCSASRTLWGSPDETQVKLCHVYSGIPNPKN